MKDITTERSNNMRELVPAYGRDYTSQKAALADWLDGKDWQDARTGQYLTREDARQYGIDAWLRYDKLRKIVRAK